MPTPFEDRLSDSPFVERVWRTASLPVDEEVQTVTSIAASRLMLVVWTQYGKTYFELRGPETKVIRAPVPEETTFFGVIFKLGSFLPLFPIGSLVDHEVTLPDASGRSFWLQGSAWEYPTYDNVDTFVNRLMRQGLMVQDPFVENTLHNPSTELSVRTVQRRFHKATGLTPVAIRQIERARYATTLLQQGVPIVDTAFRAGYFDQPHMTRALKRLIGQTPAQIMDSTRIEQMSYLYNIAPP